ncbi:MAG TPA: glucosaminidase domain-containing protein [Rhodanobacteraceae bacterium]
MTAPVANGLPLHAATSARSQRALLTSEAQKLEGALWSQLFDTMLATNLGPDTLGFAGNTYERMLFRNLAENHLGSADQGMTAAMVDQLAGELSGTKAQTPLLPALALSAAAPGDAATGTSDASFDSPEQWVKHVWGHIVAAAQSLGVPAKGLLAQSALETDWGRHAAGHNLFGVKAAAGAPGFLADTVEYLDGAMHHVEATFARYGSSAASIAHFVQLVRSAYPQAVGQGSVAGFARALQSGGYATDPNYAQKIEAIATSGRMRALLSSVRDSTAAANIPGVLVP